MPETRQNLQQISDAITLLKHSTSQPDFSGLNSFNSKHTVSYASMNKQKSQPDFKKDGVIESLKNELKVTRS